MEFWKRKRDGWTGVGDELRQFWLKVGVEAFIALIRGLTPRFLNIPALHAQHRYKLSGSFHHSYSSPSPVSAIHRFYGSVRSRFDTQLEACQLDCELREQDDQRRPSIQQRRPATAHEILHPAGPLPSLPSSQPTILTTRSLTNTALPGNKRPAAPHLRNL
jgi:hypothetical protein